MTQRLPAGESNNHLVPATPVALEPGAYGSLPAGPQPISVGTQVSRLISAIFRYKWLVLVISALGVTGSILATRFIKPDYRVSGTVYIDAARKGAGPIRAGELLQEDSWVQLIRSYAVLDPVVRKTRIYLTVAPEDSAALSGFDLAARIRPGRYTLRVDESGRRFTLQSGQGFVVDTGTVGDSIGTEVGFLWAPTASVLGRDREIRFTVRPPRDASSELLSSLRAALPGNDGVFMSVALSGQQPEQLATVLNAILDEFVSLADKLKREKLTQVTVDLENQLHTADSAAHAAETALENYRINTITEPREDVLPLPSGLSQTGSTVMGNYFQKRTLVSSLRKDRKAIEDLLRRGQREGVVPVDAFHTIPAVKNAPGLAGVLAEVTTAENEIRAQRIRYTDEHKVIQDLLAKLEDLKAKTVPAYAQRLVDQLKSQEAELEQELEIETAELRKIPVRTLTEDKYRREANAAISLSATLQNHLTNARMSELSATPDVTILDRAEVPTRPSSNTAPRIILMGVAGSIGFALALAIMLDRLDKRFRYPEQATHELGLTILGVVPVIRRDRRGLRSPTETAQIVDAFRSIRLNLAHSFTADEPILVTITSPSPGDGKSLIVANLAISFAEAGYQTLLIDGDIRRGEQYKTFQVERRPGLLDYLDRDLAVDAIISRTQHERLSIIPGGSRTSRGPELLGSGRMADLIATLRRQYQVILVDSPPLGAGVDAFVLATATGNLGVVLRAGETDRQLAEAKLELVERLPIRLVGSILNHVEVGHGSYKYYAYEYAPEPEVPAEETVAPAPATAQR